MSQAHGAFGPRVVRTAASLMITMSVLVPTVSAGAVASTSEASLKGWENRKPGAVDVFAVPVERALTDIDHEIAELRSAIGSGSLAAALGAVLGKATSADSNLGKPHDASTAVLAIANPSTRLVPAVSELDAAVRQALALLARATGGEAEAARLVRGELAAGPMRGRDLEGETDAAASEAAMIVAEALDRTLPSLLAATSTRGVGSAVEGCDVHEDLPYLCVGSAADNTYTDDAALLIDLGGNDTYLNSAGGAPFSTPSGGGSILVSVNVDLEGNDRYSGFGDGILDYNGANGRAWVGQGAAYGSALGLLVDVQGNDLYTAATPDATAERSRVLTMAQGGAAGGGVAGLFDLGGDDRYVVVAPDRVAVGGMYVQAGAIASNAALLVDAGGGDDRYEADGGDVEVSSAPTIGSGYVVMAQGAVRGTPMAVLHDDGGSDAFVARASVRNLFTSEDDVLNPIVPVVNVSAQGSGHSQDGAFLLEGEGPTTYRIESHGIGKTSAISRGQGAARPVGEGRGVLEDLGGDDAYSLTMDQVLEREIEVSASCKCTFAKAQVFASSPGELLGQGAAFLNGEGILRDMSGDDSYVAAVDQHVRVTQHDRLENPSRPPSLEVEGFTSANVIVQGSANGGTGILMEASGTDSYELRLASETTASASSANAEGSPVVTAHSWGPMGNGQGSGGAGGLTSFMDLAGSGDRIESIATAHVSTAPNPDGAFLRAGIWPRVQGAGAGARFVVLGDRPVIRSEPARPACSLNPGARRGFGTWTECPLVASEADDPEHQSFDTPSTGASSVGQAPGSTGVAPSLAITPDTPSEAPADYAETPTPDTVILPVGARLLGPDGAPLVGRRIHFTLQLGYFGSWPIVWQVDGATNQEGIARARLPLLMTGLQPEGPWRVVATFDGEAGLYSRHAALPLTLEP